MTAHLTVRLAEWLNSDVTARTFSEPLRLADRRARAANRQETRPTFTGWSGYPTHMVLCDRDGMRVRAADRDNTSVRVRGANSAAFHPRRPVGMLRGDPARRAQDAQEVFATKPAAGRPAWRLGPSGSLAAPCRRLPSIRPSSTFRTDNRKGGSQMMSRLSSVVKRHPALCVAWGRIAVPGRDTRRPVPEE
jgi:hypothetical protein